MTQTFKYMRYLEVWVPSLESSRLCFIRTLSLLVHVIKSKTVVLFVCVILAQVTPEVEEVEVEVFLPIPMCLKVHCSNLTRTVFL